MICFILIALEEAHTVLARQEQTIKTLTEQCNEAATNKLDLETKTSLDARQREGIEKRLAMMEGKMKESMSSEVKLREQLASCVEKNEILQMQKRWVGFRE